jgi:hypothetical protein
MALPVVASYAAVVGMSTSLANDKAERCEAISLKAEKDGLSRRAEERILRKENCIDK